MQRWTRAEPRLLILDPFDKDFGNVRRRVEYQDAIEELRESADEGARLGRYVPMRRRIVPDWGNLSEDAKFSYNCRDYAERLFQTLIDVCPPGAPPLNLRLQLDELSLYVGDKVRNSAIETLILQGRRMGISISAATQRVKRFPIEFRSEVTDLVAFNTIQHADLEALEEIGFLDSYEVAPTLAVGECVYVRTGMD